MKFPFSPRHLILFLGLSTFIACKKDDAPKPDPVTPDTPEQVLFGKIQGKWAAEIEAPRRTKGSLVSFKNQEPSPGIASVEFFSDSTFILGSHYIFGTTGKYSIKDSNSIQLGDVALVKNIVFSGTEISFDVTIDGETISTIAKKVQPLVLDQTQKAILKNWDLSFEDDYQGEYAYWMSEIGANKIKRLFTENGTVHTQFLKGTELVGSFVQSWKWHSTENAIVEYVYEEEISQNKYFKIKSLSSSALTLEETYLSDDEPFVENTFFYSVGAQ